MDTKENQPFAIIPLILSSGERLPCLVDAQTWIPLRVATRWAVRYRRFRVQPSTLTNNLRALAKVYRWADTVGINLDEHLLAGELLTPRQLESLATYLRTASVPKSRDVVSPNTFHNYLSVTVDFLKWALYAENRGGISQLDLEQATLQRMQLDLIFESFRPRTRRPQRQQPLTDAEIQAIRATIGPEKSASGQWAFPATCFSPRTALRNWLMFETALGIGVRRGELLKLRLDSLPRGGQAGIKVLRYPDDPHDSRPIEPAVKSAERMVPAARSLLRALQAYITLPQPQGRVKGQTPYLFVTWRGVPVSLETANDIIQAIGRHSQVAHLSWHRLRHTWAEKWQPCCKTSPMGWTN
jgi:integrase